MCGVGVGVGAEGRTLCGGGWGILRIICLSGCSSVHFLSEGVEAGRRNYVSQALSAWYIIFNFLVLLVLLNMLRSSPLMPSWMATICAVLII